jgi:hypothetical protein
VCKITQAQFVHPTRVIVYTDNTDDDMIKNECEITLTQYVYQSRVGGSVYTQYIYIYI